MFVVAEFLYALQPIVNGNEQLDNLFFVADCSMTILASVGAVILLIMDWRYFMDEFSKRDVFQSMLVVVALFGLCISYFYKSSEIEEWILLLVLYVPFYLTFRKDRKGE